MSWPLTYEDGINLRGKRCQDEAYFLCQIECKFDNYVEIYKIVLRKKETDSGSYICIIALKSNCVLCEFCNEGELIIFA